MRAATAGLRSYVRAMELVNRGVVFQGYLMRCALIRRVRAWGVAVSALGKRRDGALRVVAWRF